MKKLPSGIAAVPGVCEVDLVAGPDAPDDGPPDLLIELPHGATEEQHFHNLRRRLSGTYPDDLKAFFFVNTDVGSIECARSVARRIADPASSPELARLVDSGRRVLIVRSLIPRTFIDCNRLVDGASAASPGGEVTPGLPEYVTEAADIETLTGLHQAYQQVVQAAYELVCGGRGGLALILHTYAPKSVEIDRLDDGIVEALRRAYEPAVYATWKSRPDVDIISETTDGTQLAPAGLLAALKRQYERIGIQATECATYRLHPSTLGHVHSARYPQQVLCMEISRALLADPFRPFRPMRIAEAKVVRMTGPVALALKEAMKRT